MTKQSIPILIVLFLWMAHQTPCAFARTGEGPRKVIAKAVHNEVPDGYTRLGTTDLYYNIKSGRIFVGDVQVGSIDLVGKYGSKYYSSTYSDYGYVVAMQVDNGNAVFADCQTGTVLDGVAFSASIEPQGEMAKISYFLTNTTDKDVHVNLGAYDDVYVGDAIDASISIKRTQDLVPYGITLTDHNGAQLCLIFGSGLVGVTGVDDYWFGPFSYNTSAVQMAGNYSTYNDGNYMKENSNYDCGIGWCWKNRLVKAGETTVLSYLIAIGDVKLEPNSSFAVTPDDPDGWNDLSLPHALTLTGEYESPTGQRGWIEYAGEDSEVWTKLTDELDSGSQFTGTATVMFNPEYATHTIRFRTVDAVGNTTMLTPIVYKDVNFNPLEGIEDMTYRFGEPVVQTDLTCALEEGEYAVSGYSGNINAGTASFWHEGVFPYSIGRKKYTFDILPYELSGDLKLDQYELVFNGSNQTPDWTFTDECLHGLVYDEDYAIEWIDNCYPGDGELRIYGKGNFTSELRADFIIDKAPLGWDHQDSLFGFETPEGDITYDGKPHYAKGETEVGVGEMHFAYINTDNMERTEEPPVDPGHYVVLMSIDEGEWYYGMSEEDISGFSIYEFDDSDWVAIQYIKEALEAKGLGCGWNISGGITSAPNIPDITVEQGKVVALDLSGKNLKGEFPAEILSLSHLRRLDVSDNSLYGTLDHVAAFAKANPGTTNSVRTIDISGNAFEGNIGVFASSFPSLTSLNASGNRLKDVYPMIPATVKNLDLSGQRMDLAIDINFSDLAPESLAKQIPTILLYDHEAQDYTRQLNIRCTAENGWWVYLVLAGKNFYIKDGSFGTSYTGKPGDTLTVETVNGDGNPSSFSMRLWFDMGDADFLGGVNLADLQATVLYAFNEYQNRPFNFTAADTFTDDRINVQDVVGTAGVILSKEAPAANASETEGSSVLAIPDVFSSPGKYVDVPVNLDNPDDVTAVQFTVTLADGLSLDPGAIKETERCKAHTVTARATGSNTYMVMLYSVTNTLISGDEGAILNLPVKVDASVDEFRTYPITISSAVACAADGSDVLASAQSGAVLFNHPVDSDEWESIKRLHAALVKKEWKYPWDLSGGSAAASRLHGLKVEDGKVKGIFLDNQGISGSFPLEVFAFSSLDSISMRNNKLSGNLNNVAAFAEGYPDALKGIRSINISHNRLDGNIGLFASLFPDLKGLDASFNGFTDVLPMIQPSVTDLRLYGQNMDRVVEVNFSNIDVEQVARQIPLILMYNHKEQAFNRPMRIRCTDKDGWWMQLAFSGENIGLEDGASDAAFMGENGEILEVATVSDSEPASSFGLRLLFEMGDANFWDGVDITDLQTTILYIFGEYKGLPFNFTAADTYTDRRINVQDVVCTVNILLSQDMVFYAMRRAAPADLSEPCETCFYIEDGALYVESEAPVAAFSIAHTGSMTLDVASYGMETASAEGKAVVYSPTLSTLPAGRTRIATVSDDAEIICAEAADAAARRLITGVAGPGHTGVSSAAMSGDSKVYDVHGRRLNGTQKGVNIIVKDGKAHKSIK